MARTSYDAQRNDREVELISADVFARGTTTNHGRTMSNAYVETDSLNRTTMTHQIELPYERATATKAADDNTDKTRQMTPSTTTVVIPTNEVNGKGKGFVKLGTFDGSSALHLFLRRFEICKTQQGWTDDVSAQQLICALTGQAGQLIGENDSTDELTTERLIAKLKLRFGTEEMSAYFQVKLMTRRQKSTETLSELAADIQNLVSQAFP